MVTPLKVLLCAGLVCGIPSLTVGALKGLDIETFLAFRGSLRVVLTTLKVGNGDWFVCGIPSLAVGALKGLELRLSSLFAGRCGSC